MTHPNFAALRELHNSANTLLHSQMIKQDLVHNQQEKQIAEVCEASLQMLDACGTTKDAILLVKDHLHELQSTFRRISAGETTIENKFAAFYIHRKKLKKNILNCLRSLKKMKNSCIIMNSDLSPIDQNLVVVVNVLRQVRVTIMSIVETVISLMSMPSPESKPYKGSFTSKFMRVNSLSLWENCDTSAFRKGNKRLEAAEMAIKDLDVELECIFRGLIETRVSLLNILTN